MKSSEAARLVGMLFAYFPTKDPTPETTTLWAMELTRFELEDGMEAAKALGLMGKFLPSLAEFVDGITEERNARMARERALPQHGADGVPFSQFLSENPDMAERVKALTTSTAATKPFPSTGQLGLVALLEGEIRT